MSPPPLSLQPVTNMKKKKTKPKTGVLYLVLRCDCIAAALANVHMSECFQHHGQRNFIVYTLIGPRDPPPPPPQLQAVLTSLPLIRMSVRRWQ